MRIADVVGGFVLVVVAVGWAAPARAQPPPAAACNFLYASLRDLYLHFTAWDDKDGVIEGRLKNTHPFETAREAVIRFTFALNPHGGGFRAGYCLVVGDIPPGEEVPFRFIRPEEVKDIRHALQDPHALW